MTTLNAADQRTTDALKVILNRMDHKLPELFQAFSLTRKQIVTESRTVRMNRGNMDAPLHIVYLKALMLAGTYFMEQHRLNAESYTRQITDLCRELIEVGNEGPSEHLVNVSGGLYERTSTNDDRVLRVMRVMRVSEEHNFREAAEHFAGGHIGLSRDQVYHIALLALDVVIDVALDIGTDFFDTGVVIDEGRNVSIGGVAYAITIEKGVPVLNPATYPLPKPGETWSVVAERSQLLVTTAGSVVNLETAKLTPLVDHAYPGTEIGVTFKRIK